MHVPKLVKLCMLNMWIFFYVSYTLVKLFFFNVSLASILPATGCFKILFIFLDLTDASDFTEFSLSSLFFASVHSFFISFMNFWFVSLLNVSFWVSLLVHCISHGTAPLQTVIHSQHFNYLLYPSDFQN